MTVEQKVKELHHFINGELVAGKSGRFSNVYNPSTGKSLHKFLLLQRKK